MKKKKIIIAVLAVLAFGMILNALGYGDDEPAQTIEPTVQPTSEPISEPTLEPTDTPILSDASAYATAQTILRKVYDTAEFESYLLGDNFSISSSVFDGFERYKVEGIMTIDDVDHEFVVTFELDHDNLEEVQTDLVEIDKVTVYDRYAE